MSYLFQCLKEPTNKFMSEIFIKIINLFKSSKSKYILGFVSFIESIFFPIPADAVLIPMVLTQNYNWKKLALLTTVMSVFGGMIGYMLGSYLFAEINPLILEYGFSKEFDLAQNLYIEYGVIILFIASFTPIPYQVFVIAAGFLSINFIMFVIVSIIGRGLRFFLVAYLADRYRENIVHYLNRYILQISVIVILLFIIYKLYN